MSSGPRSSDALRRRPSRTVALSALLLGAVLSGAVASAQEADPWPMAGRDAAHSATAEGPAPPYREAWNSAVGFGGPVAGPVVGRDILVVVAEGGVLGLDPVTGEPTWEAVRSEGPAGPPVLAGDLVVHASGSGSATSLVARSLSDGSEAWRASVDADVGGGLVTAGELVYAGTAAGEVIALRVATGEEAWRAEVGGRLEAAPAVAEGLVLVAREEPATDVVTVFALDAATGGDSEWRYATPGAAAPPSAPASLEGRAVVATSEGLVRALDLESGSELWAADVRAAVSPRQVPAASDPVIVADRLHVYGLDPNGGEVRWTFLLADLATLPDGRRNTLTPASPAVLGRAAVIGDTSGVLSAIDVASGRRVWRGDLGSGPLGPVVAGGELLYATTLGDGGSVTALEHNAEGPLLDEPSPTTVFPLRAVLNFALAAAGIGVVALGLSRLMLRRTTGP